MAFFTDKRNEEVRRLCLTTSHMLAAFVKTMPKTKESRSASETQSQHHQSTLDLNVNQTFNPFMRALRQSESTSSNYTYPVLIA